MISINFTCQDGAPQNANTWACLRDALRKTKAYTQAPDEDLCSLAVNAIRNALEDRAEYTKEGLDKALDRIIELYKDAPEDPNPTWPKIIDLNTDKDSNVNLDIGIDCENAFHNNFNIELIIPTDERLDPKGINKFILITPCEEKDEDD